MPAFMALEPLLVARLREQLPTNVMVFTASELAKIEAKAQYTPAVHVVNTGHDVSEANNLVEITEKWLTVIAVRHAGDTVGGQGARASAGPIMSAVWDALHGWKPGTDYKAMRPDSPPGGGFDGGFGYYPLAWSARMTKIPNPCPTAIT